SRGSEGEKRGDRAAMGVCRARLSRVRRGGPVAFELPPLNKPADSVAAAAEIVAAVSAGELTPSEAAELAKVIDVYVLAIATNAFDERLTKLEATTPRWQPVPPNPGPCLPRG